MNDDAENKSRTIIGSNFRDIVARILFAVPYVFESSPDRQNEISKPSNYLPYHTLELLL
jgi:hypothetical protein